MLLYKTNAFREDLLYHRTLALESLTGRTEDCQTPLFVGAWLPHGEEGFVLMQITSLKAPHGVIF